MKALIAYYSHSSNTKKLAEFIGKVIKSEFPNAETDFFIQNQKSRIHQVTTQF
nr:hypothetical protein [Brachyspira hyodysenteriae]